MAAAGLGADVPRLESEYVGIAAGVAAGIDGCRGVTALVVKADEPILPLAGQACTAVLMLACRLEYKSSNKLPQVDVPVNVVPADNCPSPAQPVAGTLARLAGCAHFAISPLGSIRSSGSLPT
jgi:hypothetical protein